MNWNLLSTPIVAIKTHTVACVGGFKRIEFMDNDTIKYEYLPTDIFSDYDTHLVFTGVTRNSKTILKDITNLDKVYPLLSGVDKAFTNILRMGSMRSSSTM